MEIRFHNVLYQANNRRIDDPSSSIDDAFWLDLPYALRLDVAAVFLIAIQFSCNFVKSQML